jgi:hypothetical protein
VGTPLICDQATSETIMHCHEADTVDETAFFRAFHLIIGDQNFPDTLHLRQTIGVVMP